MFLNIHESSIKKKRVASLFGNQADLDADCNAAGEKRIAPKHLGKITNIQVEELDDENDLGTAVQTIVEEQMTPAVYAEPFSAKTLADARAAVKSTKGAAAARHPKEILSAMVRLNSEGLNEPVDLASYGRILPELPGSAVGTKPKANYLTAGNGIANILTEVDEFEYDGLDRSVARTVDAKGDDDTTTVFDIVHRGRQVEQQLKVWKGKTSRSRADVHSPKIIAQVSQGRRIVEPTAKSTRSITSGHFSKKTGSVPNSNYRTVAAVSKTLARSQDRKNAIKDLNKEVQSALLPDIQNAVKQQRTRSLELRKPKQRKKRVEYLHEERFDEHKKGKWTFFNTKAVEVEESTSEEDPAHGCKEDSILEDLRLREQMNNGVSNLTIPDQVWVMLYEAKCMDLGIPARSDKQLERFLSQMKLY